MIMNEKKNPMTQTILDLTLEILYLLTGEHHIVVKIPCASDEGDGSRHKVSEGYCSTHSASTEPPPLSLSDDRRNEQKILELTHHILRLLTQEVPIRCEDVTIHLSMEEWEYVERHKELYKDVMTEDHQPVITADKPVPGEFHAPVSLPDFGTKYMSSDEGRHLKNTAMNGQCGSARCTTEEALVSEDKHVTDVNVCRPQEHEGIDYSASEPLKEVDLQDIGTDMDPHVFTPPLIEFSNLDQSDYNKADNPILLDTKPIFNLSESPKHIYTDTQLISHNSVYEENAFTSSEIKRDLSSGSDFAIGELNGRSEELYTSSDCTGNFTGWSELLNFQNVQPGEQPFPCSDCGIRFTSSFALKMHQRFHMGENTFKCTECGKCFATRKEHTKHRRIHARGRAFKCPECGRCFSQAAYLASHRQIHLTERPFKCSECGEHFAWSAQLDSHRQLHACGKPFKCPDCGKCFSSATQVQKHAQIHAVEKTFICNECGKCFAQVLNLELHRLIHAGVKPYKCTECGRGFTRASYLSAHKKIHTGQKPFKCHYCGRCFNRKSSFTRHQKVHGR